MSEIMELLNGKQTDKYLAFLDVWGTTARIEKSEKSGDLLDHGDLAQIQSTFLSVLAAVASQNSDVDILTASDGAYVVSSDINKLLKILRIIMSGTQTWKGHFHLIPLRGAISTGLSEIRDDKQALTKIPNFHYMPYFGSAFVKTYLMEKLAPKGMRVFVTESVKDKIEQTGSQLSPSMGSVGVLNGQKEPYYELNWLDNSVLDDPIGHTTFGSELSKVAQIFREKGSSYQKDIGLSLQGLIEWVNTGKWQG